MQLLFDCYWYIASVALSMSSGAYFTNSYTYLPFFYCGIPNKLVQQDASPRNELAGMEQRRGHETQYLREGNE